MTSLHGSFLEVLSTSNLFFFHMNLGSIPKWGMDLVLFWKLYIHVFVVYMTYLAAGFKYFLFSPLFGGNDPNLTI